MVTQPRIFFPKRVVFRGIGVHGFFQVRRAQPNPPGDRRLKEGEVGAGDEFELLKKNASGVRVVDVTRLYSSDKENVDLMRRAVATEALPDNWKNYFLKRIESLNVAGSSDE